MGTGLVVASVTRTLRDSLMHWLQASPDVPGARPVEIATLPPAMSATGVAGNGLTAYLTLYRIGVDSARRNLPTREATSRGVPGGRTQEAQALELDYLIGVTSTREFDSELVLGAALDWAQQTPVLSMQVPAHGPGTPSDSWQLKIVIDDLSAAELAAIGGGCEGNDRARVAINVRVVAE